MTKLHHLLVYEYVAVVITCVVQLHLHPRNWEGPEMVVRDCVCARARVCVCVRIQV